MTRTVIVCGPPGSGKTTYVERRMVRGDVIVDFDALASAISGLPWYDTPPNVIAFAVAAKAALIARLERDGRPARAWVITSGQTRSERHELRDRLNAEVVVLEVAPDVCYDRIRDDERRNTRPEHWQVIIARWWSQYESSDEDTRLIQGEI